MTHPNESLTAINQEISRESKSNLAKALGLRNIEIITYGKPDSKVVLEAVESAEKPDGIESVVAVEEAGLAGLPEKLKAQFTLGTAVAMDINYPPDQGGRPGPPLPLVKGAEYRVQPIPKEQLIGLIKEALPGKEVRLLGLSTKVPEPDLSTGDAVVDIEINAQGKIAQNNTTVAHSKDPGSRPEISHGADCFALAFSAAIFEIQATGNKPILLEITGSEINVANITALLKSIGITWPFALQVIVLSGESKMHAPVKFPDKNLNNPQELAGYMAAFNSEEKLFAAGIKTDKTPQGAVHLHARGIDDKAQSAAGHWDGVSAVGQTKARILIAVSPLEKIINAATNENKIA